MIKTKRAARAARQSARSAVKSPFMWLMAARPAIKALEPSGGPTADIETSPGGPGGTPVADMLSRGQCKGKAGGPGWLDVGLEATIGCAGDDVIAATITVVAL